MAGLKIGPEINANFHRFAAGERLQQQSWTQRLLKKLRIRTVNMTPGGQLAAEGIPNGLAASVIKDARDVPQIALSEALDSVPSSGSPSSDPAPTPQPAAPKKTSTIVAGLKQNKKEIGILSLVGAVTAALPFSNILLLTVPHFLAGLATSTVGLVVAGITSIAVNILFAKIGWEALKLVPKLLKGRQQQLPAAAVQPQLSAGPAGAGDAVDSGAASSGRATASAREAKLSEIIDKESYPSNEQGLRAAHKDLQELRKLLAQAEAGELSDARQGQAEVKRGLILGNIRDISRPKKLIVEAKDGEAETRIFYIVPMEKAVDVAWINDGKMVGKGGFGQVYDVIDSESGDTKVIKLVNEKPTPDNPDPFKREIMSMMKLDDPSIVKALAYGTYKSKGGTNYPVLVMERVDWDLMEKTLRETTFGEEETIDVSLELARIIDVAHSNGVVHRDLKPSNIFYKKEKDVHFVKVFDFGISKLKGAAPEETVLPTGSFKGTPGYSAPYHIAQTMFTSTAEREDRITEQSDVYALGATSYKMMMGHPFIWQDGSRMHYIGKKDITDKKGKRVIVTAVDGEKTFMGIFTNAYLLYRKAREEYHAAAETGGREKMEECQETMADMKSRFILVQDTTHLPIDPKKMRKYKIPDNVFAIINRAMSFDENENFDNVKQLKFAWEQARDGWQEEEEDNKEPTLESVRTADTRPAGKGAPRIPVAAAGKPDAGRAKPIRERLIPLPDDKKETIVMEQPIPLRRVAGATQALMPEELEILAEIPALDLSGCKDGNEMKTAAFQYLRALQDAVADRDVMGPTDLGTIYDEIEKVEELLDTHGREGRIGQKLQDLIKSLTMELQGFTK